MGTSDSTVESISVVVVGGGVAGLVAAWSLRRRGVRDVVVLELEEQAGGNARWGEDGPGGTKYPWGAHYVPIPSRRSREVRSVFAELGLLRPSSDSTGVSSSASTSADDLLADVPPGIPTCESPTERLFYPDASSGGHWRDGADGLAPLEVMSADDLEQLHRFRSLVQAEARRLTADGRTPFTVPLAECSRDAHAVRLDTERLVDWLERHQLLSGPLRWFIEYGMRDDYGAGLNMTSAWAGRSAGAHQPESHRPHLCILAPLTPRPMRGEVRLGVRVVSEGGW